MKGQLLKTSNEPSPVSFAAESETFSLIYPVMWPSSEWVADSSTGFSVAERLPWTHTTWRSSRGVLAGIWAPAYTSASSPDAPRQRKSPQCSRPTLSDHPLLCSVSGPLIDLQLPMIPTEVTKGREQDLPHVSLPWSCVHHVCHSNGHLLETELFQDWGNWTYYTAKEGVHSSPEILRRL